MRLRWRDRLWLATLAVAPIGLTTCRQIAESAPLPQGALSFTPPPYYAQWWGIMQSCSGISSPMPSVRWYVVPGAVAINDTMAGYWDDGLQAIVLAGAYQNVGMVVRHEMLHALLGATPNHPPQYFHDLCGGLLLCDAECLTNAGSPPVIPTNAPVLSPGALTVAVAPTPDSIGIQATGGIFTFVAYVVNPNPVPVLIQLAPYSWSTNEAPTFGLGLGRHYPAFQGSIADTLRLGFQPSEVKQFAFDVDLSILGPGPLQMRAWFNTDTAQARTIIVTP